MFLSKAESWMSFKHKSDKKRTELFENWHGEAPCSVANSISEETGNCIGNVWLFFWKLRKTRHRKNLTTTTSSMVLRAGKGTLYGPEMK